AGLVRRLDSELLPVLPDQPDARDADAVVDARLGLGAMGCFEAPGTPTRPQLSSKLVLTSFTYDTTAGRQRQRISINLARLNPRSSALGGEETGPPLLARDSG